MHVILFKKPLLTKPHEEISCFDFSFLHSLICWSAEATIINTNNLIVFIY